MHERELAQANAGSRTVSRRDERARARFGLLLAAPAVLIFVAIIGYPLVQSVITSLYDASLLRPGRAWVGLENFRSVLGGSTFWPILRATGVFVLGTTGLGVALSFLWALFLNESFPGRNVLRGLSLIPWIVPSTVGGFLWLWMFHGQFGVINGFLRTLGVLDRPIVWLASPAWAQAAVILARVWQAMPWYTLLLLAGLQGIDRQILEAARVDGAGNLRLVTRVILPQVRFILFLTTMLALIGNLQHFDLIWVMTGGGPGRATATFSVEVYQQAFQRWDTGTAAAIGVLWMGFISVVAFFYLRRLDVGE
ncbi:sugar ABC transporter permease [Limnochorda pilosa]|uniref:Sugar ABC transporter permease n=1 Tax=Limnochorda pilosa TaxID=1555112 RepID=A0A0K2SGT7_LIMPI|nr:sugar ABC transporter permease [Limnochorda pilosa]